MKKILFAGGVAATLLLSSCGADQATVDKMAGEMCTAMESYDPEDPIGSLGALSAIMDIAGKSDEYGSVTESQLNGAMEQQCPDGYTKYQGLLESAQ